MVGWEGVGVGFFFFEERRGRGGDERKIEGGCSGFDTGGEEGEAGFG